jgi:hypothetical protein
VGAEWELAVTAAGLQTVSDVVSLRIPAPLLTAPVSVLSTEEVGAGALKEAYAGRAVIAADGTVSAASPNTLRVRAKHLGHAASDWTPAKGGNGEAPLSFATIVTPRGARSSPLACSAETDGATAADGEVRALVCALEFLGERGRAAGSGTTAWQWLSNELGDGARTGESVQVSVEISVDNQAAAPSPLSLLLTPLPAGESAADIAAREGSFFISFYSPICSSFLFFAHQFLVFIYYKYYRAKSVSG